MAVWNPGDAVEWNNLWPRAGHYELVEEGGELWVKQAKVQKLDWYDPLAAPEDGPEKQPRTREEARGCNPAADLAALLALPNRTPAEALAHIEGPKPKGHRENTCPVCARVQLATVGFAHRWGLPRLQEVSRWAGPEGQLPLFERAGHRHGVERFLDMLEASYLMGALLAKAEAYNASEGEAREAAAKDLNFGFDMPDPAGGLIQVPGLTQELLDGVRPRTVWDRKSGALVLGYEFRSLWHACYLRVALTVTRRGRYWRQCAHRRCGVWFLTDNPRRIYCSDQSQNAAEQEARRRRAGVKRNTGSAAGRGAAK